MPRGKHRPKGNYQMLDTIPKGPTSVDIKPIYEWGIFCRVCQVMTIHRYIGPQFDDKGEIILRFWGCTRCGDTVAGESPEECGKRAFRIETRRMRQRRAKRRWG